MVQPGEPRASRSCQRNRTLFRGQLGVMEGCYAEKRYDHEKAGWHG